MTAIYVRLAGVGSGRAPGGVRLMASAALADGRVLGLTLPLPAGWAVLPPRARRGFWPDFGQRQYTLCSPNGKVAALTVWADPFPGEAAPSDRAVVRGRAVMRGAVALEGSDGYFTLAAAPPGGNLTLEWDAPAPGRRLWLVFTGAAAAVLEPLIPCLPHLRCLRAPSALPPERTGGLGSVSAENQKGPSREG